MSSGNTAFACRLLWEVHNSLIGIRNNWNPVNVGGGKAPFYRSPFMVFFYRDNWGCMRAFPGFSLKNTDLFWRPAIGWGKRTDVLSTQLLPDGMITAEDGQVFVPHILENIWVLLGYLNSRYAQAAINCICGGHKGPGYLAKIPFSRKLFNESEMLELAKEGYLSQREACQIDETTIDFSSPFAFASGREWAYKTLERVNSIQIKVNEVLRKIDATVYKGLEKSDDDIAAIERVAPSLLVTSVEWPLSSADLFSSLFSFVIGILYGRWDVRITLDPANIAKVPDPLSPQPICPPGMLVDSTGLPAKPGNIVSEEWLRARPDANTLPPEGTVKRETILDSEYPIDICWSGILVDDPGHPDDIITRIRSVFDVIWKDKASEIYAEAIEILDPGKDDLRPWFRTNFFADHIRRYSKSRRKAPIYWCLSTPSRSYAVWLYYHRFNKDTLYKVLNDCAKPKLQLEERKLASLRVEIGDSPSSAQRKQLADQEKFVAELKAFHDEVALVAPLWKPDLNDGVIINFAPLWRLAPQPSTWQRECKQTWDALGSRRLRLGSSGNASMAGAGCAKMPEGSQSRYRPWSGRSVMGTG